MKKLYKNFVGFGIFSPHTVVTHFFFLRVMKWTESHLMGLIPIETSMNGHQLESAQIKNTFHWKKSAFHPSSFPIWLLNGVQSTWLQWRNEPKILRYCSRIYWGSAKKGLRNNNKEKKVNKMSSTLLCIGHPLHGKTLFRIGFFHSFHSHIDPSFSFLFLCSLLGLFERERENNMFRSQCIPFSLALYNPIHRSSCFSFSCAML